MVRRVGPRRRGELYSRARVARATGAHVHCIGLQENGHGRRRRRSHGVVCREDGHGGGMGNAADAHGRQQNIPAESEDKVRREVRSDKQWERRRVSALAGIVRATEGRRDVQGAEWLHGLFMSFRWIRPEPADADRESTDSGYRSYRLDRMR